MGAMRVAALYDIHGNLPALEAVLAEVRHAGVDQIVVGGDVTPGPMVRESLDRLRALDVPVHFIYGNCEVAVLAERGGTDPGVPEQAREAIRWTAQQLTADEARELAGWPKTLQLEVTGLGEVLFCHGTPRHENEIFTRLTPDDRLRPIFDGLDVVVCGHTHMQFDRVVGRTRIVNAGSVGMPFGEPGADWALLGPHVELRHTAYDLTAAAERIRATPYPQAAQFAEAYVLHPPSADRMLQVFAGFEVK